MERSFQSFTGLFKFSLTLPAPNNDRVRSGVVSLLKLFKIGSMYLLTMDSQSPRVSEYFCEGFLSLLLAHKKYFSVKGRKKYEQ